MGYGQFLTVAINFLIVAWVLFLVIRAMNRLRRTEDALVDVPKSPEIPADVKLLSEIRDLLAADRGTVRGKFPSGTLTAATDHRLLGSPVNRHTPRRHLATSSMAASRDG